MKKYNNLTYFNAPLIVDGKCFHCGKLKEDCKCMS